MAIKNLPLVAILLAFFLISSIKPSESKQHKRSGIIPSLAFYPGHDYKFHYDAQTTSGYAQWISTQRAMSRIQSKITITFKSNSDAILQMQEVRMGQLNGIPPVEPMNPARIQPIDIFESTTSANNIKFNELLELPVYFSYDDGIVSKIRFDSTDEPWSKNIKKGILNMLQIRLRSKKQYQDQNELKVEKELRKAKRDSIRTTNGPLEFTNGQQQLLNTFTASEIGIEGKCETVYTISQEKTGFNVTKSLNFDDCETFVETAYGMHIDEYIPSSKAWFIQQDLLPQHQKNKTQMVYSNRTVHHIIERQLLDRSSTINYVLQIEDPKSDDNVQQKAKGEDTIELGLKHAELLSSYVLKGMDSESSQAMQTIAAAQLTFIGSYELTKANKKRKVAESPNMKEESLMYNADHESRECLFNMFGDDEVDIMNKRAKEPVENIVPVSFNYPNSEMKIKKVIESLQKVSEANIDDFRGGENRPVGIAEELDELVSVLRICTMEEIQKILASTEVASCEKAKSWLEDALAVAATRNTLKILTEKIQKEEIKGEFKAVRLLTIFGSGNGIPSPSDRIADLMVALCKSSYVQGTQLLKQTCWLSFGAILNELQRMAQKARATRTHLIPEIIMPPRKMDFYKRVFMDQLKITKDHLHEKIAIIKAIGNSGMKEIVMELKDIALDRNEFPIVRIAAIEAFRNVISQRAYSVLLTMFQDITEQPNIRMMSFSVLINSLRIPPKHIADLIAQTMVHEPFEQVRNFVYSGLRSLANSPIIDDQHRAAYLKNVLRLTEIDFDNFELYSGRSRSQRMPFYSPLHKEGYFLEAIRIYNGNSKEGPVPPMHFSVSLDELFNGRIAKDKIKLSVCQNNIDMLIRHLLNIEDLEKRKKEEEKKESLISSAANQIFSLLNKLGIGISRNDDKTQKKPMVLISLRSNNMDSLVLPIGGHPDINEGFKLIRNLRDSIFTKAGLTSMSGPNMDGIVGWKERSARVPTSIGVELKIKQTSFVYGKMKLEMDFQGQSQLNLQASTSLTRSSIQKMKIWSTPIHGSGVKRVITSELKLPIEANAQIISGLGKQRSLKLNFRVPQQKIRVFALHTIPMTFVTETEGKAREGLSHGEHVSIVRNSQLESQQREFQRTVGFDSLRLPLKVQLSWHRPRKLSALKEIVKSLYASENHFHVDFEPISGETPREIALQFVADLFNSYPNASLHAQGSDWLPSFRDIKLRTLSDDHYDQWKHREHRKNGTEQVMNLFRNIYALEKAYKHSFKLLAESVGGTSPKRGEIQIDLVSDAKMQTYNVEFRAERSALFKEEKDKWKLNGQLQAYYPDTVMDVEEMVNEQQSLNQKYFLHAKMNWGLAQAKTRQSISIGVKGEPSHEMLQRAFANFGEVIQTVGMPQTIFRPQAPLPFINNLAVALDYQLRPRYLSFSSKLLSTLKTFFFWNIESQIIDEETLHKDAFPPKDILNGRIQADIELIPTCMKGTRHNGNNVTLSTSGQFIRIGVEMPTSACFMPLVRKSPIQRPIHSLQQFLSNIGVIQTSGECLIDHAGQITTFDGASYRAPFSSCYSVLTKEGNETDPKFAVLIKELGNGERILKVVVPKRTIEVRSNPEKPLKLRVKVNKQEYSAEDMRDKEDADTKDIEFIGSNHGRESVVIDEKSLYVRFNGKVAQVHLSGEFKRRSFGLCGNFDEDMFNEFRGTNGQETQKLSDFIKSYTFDDNEKGCNEESQREFIKNQFGSNENGEEMAPNKFSLIDNSKKRREFIYDEPIEKTYVREHNHKVCISLKPVKQCPKGLVSDASIFSKDGSQPEQINVAFACFDRYSIQAKRAKEVSRKNKILTDNFVSTAAPSFSEVLPIPKRCIKH